MKILLCYRWNQLDFSWCVWKIHRKGCWTFWNKSLITCHLARLTMEMCLKNNGDWTTNFSTPKTVPNKGKQNQRVYFKCNGWLIFQISKSERVKGKWGRKLSYICWSLWVGKESTFTAQRHKIKLTSDTKIKSWNRWRGRIRLPCQNWSKTTLTHKKKTKKFSFCPGNDKNWCCNSHRFYALHNAKRLRKPFIIN